VKKFENFPHARKILELEIKRDEAGLIDIERLMTRLDGCMPYDFSSGANEELSLLLSALKHQFLEKLQQAKTGRKHTIELAAFAKHCVNNGITCITFNYDDVLDQALWETMKTRIATTLPHWHPDGGYGFFCQPSESCVVNREGFKDITSMLLLKLHGSVNWRIKLGSPRPYVVDVIVHDEEWLGESEYFGMINRKDIALHLEPDPFIVPQKWSFWHERLRKTRTEHKNLPWN